MIVKMRIFWYPCGERKARYTEQVGGRDIESRTVEGDDHDTMLNWLMTSGHTVIKTSFGLDVQWTSTGPDDRVQ